MSKGLKRICMNCGMRFYDLNKDPIICPSCNTEFTGEVKVKTRRGRVAVAEELAKQAPKVAAEIEEDEDVADIDADDDIVSLDDVDDDGLDDDDDDDATLTIDDDIDDLDDDLVDDIDDLDDEDEDDEDEEEEN